MAFQSGISNSWDPIPAVRSLTEPSAPLDWKETPNAHVFLVDLPGTKRDGVKVEIVEGNILQISGERKEEDVEGKDDTWHRKERSGGPFLRKLRLPENANVDQVKAGLANGVLTVTVPKMEESKKAEVKNIEIFGGDAKKGDKNKMSKKKGMLLCCGLGD